MPNFTVVRSDNIVLVDGVSRKVDCSHLPEFFHVIQWYDGASPPYGEIEYAADSQGRRMPNTRFSDISPYQYLKDAWTVEDARVRAAIAAQEQG